MPYDPQAFEIMKEELDAARTARADIRKVGEDGREFYFRPAECIVRNVDLPQVFRRLVDEGFEPVPVDFRPRVAGVAPGVAPEGRAAVPFTVFRNRDPKYPDGKLIELVEELRRLEPPPEVGLNHLLFGQPHAGCPAGPPEAVAITPEEPGGCKGMGINVGVIDTGIWTAHPWFHGHVHVLPQGEETPTNPLGFEDGHGTFVAGVVRQIAPAALLLVAGTLDPDGVADDGQVGAALAALASRNACVINMSLGGYTHNDIPPVGTTSVISLMPEIAMVAAAGNDRRARPLWPAALADVHAVGALDPGTGRPTEFTNFGPWVDACAPGQDLVSSFFRVKAQLKSRPGAGPVDFNGYASWSGTSFAAPQLSGAIALVMHRQSCSAQGAAALLVARGAAIPDLGRAFEPNLLVH